MERVFVVVVPKTSIQYDADKEEKLLQEGKMAALQRGEEARQKQQEMEKGWYSVHTYCCYYSASLLSLSFIFPIQICSSRDSDLGLYIFFP